MADNFNDALKLVLGAEGKFSDNPADPGGATMYGVTQRVYDNWRKSRGLTARSVRLIEQDEVEKIYDHLYWTPAHCADLPNKAAIVMFDAAVNCGVGGATKLLQEALKVSADGAFGPATLAAVKKADEVDLVDEFLDVRVEFYEDLCKKNPSEKVFLQGWKNRMEHLRKVLLG